MREEVEESIRMIKHSFVEGTFVRLNINTGEEIPLTADMCLEPIIKDLEVLDILKKFFNFNAYYKRSVNSDFLEIISKEDEEANIDRKAISFIDGDSRKLLKEWLEDEN